MNLHLDNLKKLYAFSWGQAFSDTNGKTTIVPVSGFYVVLIGGIGFIYGGIIKDSNLVTQSVLMVTIGSGLLLGRKIVNGKPGEMPTIDNCVEDPKMNS